MGVNIQIFNQKIDSMDKNDVKNLYKSLKNNDFISETTEIKLKIIEDKFPELKNIESATENTQLLFKDSKKINKPYQIKLCEKFIQLYRNSQKRDKEFNLDIKDVHYLLQQKSCYYTDIPFEQEGQYARTVDRIDSTKGYIKGNVVACTDVANQLKESLFERPTQELKTNIQFIYKVTNKVLDHIGYKEDAS